MLRQIDADPSLHFVLHAGDLKGGSEPCSDELLRRRLAQFDLVRTALVYTPGDNDWTDRHRPAAGRFSPLERLVTLRALAFARPDRSFGRRPLRLRSQAESALFAEFVENTMFDHGNVVFATLHVVGGNNGLSAWYGIDANDRVAAPRADRSAEFRRRQAANLDWLQTVFTHAESIKANAVVVLTQANPRFELGSGHAKRSGFAAVTDELHRLAHRFARPVLLAHGDQHWYLVDRPLIDAQPPAPNLLRVQAFGHPWLLWVRVDVDPRWAEVFTVSAGVQSAAVEDPILD